MSCLVYVLLICYEENGTKPLQSSPLLKFIILSNKKKNIRQTLKKRYSTKDLTSTHVNHQGHLQKKASLRNTMIKCCPRRDPETEKRTLEQSTDFS